MKNIIVIVGPTASGKTDLSIRLAKIFDGECINADSTQIFEGTDIATNKITPEETEGIKQHLLSIRKVNETYSVAEFQTDSRIKIEEILNINKTPILVGGTGLYVNAALMKYNFTTSSHIKNFQENFKDLTNNEIWNILNSRDEVEAQKIHENNRIRMIRALEIIELSGHKKTDVNNNNKEFFYKNLIIIGILPQRDKLYSKINNRVLILTKKGLFNEIEKAFKENKFNRDAQSLRCIGGPEIIKYLEKEIDYNSCIELMQKNNRNYARRQITWFKNQLAEVKWFEHNYDNFDSVENQIVNYIKTKIK